MLLIGYLSKYYISIGSSASEMFSNRQFQGLSAKPNFSALYNINLYIHTPPYYTVDFFASDM